MSTQSGWLGRTLCDGSSRMRRGARQVMDSRASNPEPPLHGSLHSACCALQMTQLCPDSLPLSH